MPRPDTLCMAPWTHTYLSPQTERRLCCASRESAQSFQQYIDTGHGTGEYNPVSLEQHWNSDHMRGVRRRMMAGEILPECAVCNEKLLNTDVYRSYFNRMFEHKYDEVMAKTDATGHTLALPISWDYRFSNLCNFKCRTCGDMLSSSWETEQRQHNMIDWGNTKNNWMIPAVREKISKFQDTQIETEFAQAVQEHRVEEVYWVGGEPLMYEQHWKYMKQIVDQGDGARVYARYNSNLSRVDYRGINLYKDILSHLRDWQICASLDGTGPVGEYIRTGLNFDAWLKNFQQGVEIATHPRQMRLDFTITLPGLFEVANMIDLSKQLGVDMLAKVIFSFGPDIIMSPLALPRHLLDRKINELLPIGSGAVRDVISQLRHRPTFQEQWPEQWQAGLVKGKRRVLKLEQIRGDAFTLADALQTDMEIYDWYQAIAT